MEARPRLTRAMADTHVRQLTLCDLDACVAIECVCYPEAVCEGHAVFACKLAHHAEGCWAAVDASDQVLGYALSLPACAADCPIELSSSSHPSSVTADTLYLHDVAVSPAAQGRGIGRILFQRTVEHARACGVPSITLTAVCGAWAHWTRRGFVPCTEHSKAALERLASYPAEAGESRVMRLDLRTMDASER
jgi:GNAT superfamily N-acetyltransferase